MLFIIVIAGLASSVLALDVSNAEPNYNLKLIHAVFRHGQRTPTDTYPNDPYVNSTFPPYGLGELTNPGKKELFDNGRWLRSRYNTFLGGGYYPDIVYSYSTGMSRSKMSLALTQAGLFPPVGTPLCWNSLLNWQPIPYDTTPLAEEKLLLVFSPCPRYDEELSRVLREDPELVKFQKDNQQIFKELSECTGLSISTPLDIIGLHSTIKSQIEYGYKLQACLKNYYPNPISPISEKSWVILFYNTIMQKIKAGAFVAKLIDDWNSVKTGTITPKTRKIFLYSGHDYSVVSILSALKIWKQQYPGYGIMLVCELYEHKTTKEMSVKFLLKNGAKTEVLIIPGCLTLCPLEKLKELTAAVIPAKDGSDCNAVTTTATKITPLIQMNEGNSHYQLL